MANITKEEVIELYINQNLPRAEVAAHFGLKDGSLKKYLQHWGIKKDSAAHVANIKKACLEKYGTTNGGWTEAAQKKIKATNLEKYGSESYLQTDDYKEKTQKTLKEKYGENVTNVFQTKEVKEKIKQTNLERYGSEYNMQNKEVRNKVDETKKKNGTFNTSLWEQEIKQLLEKKFPDSKYQYKSNDYPFNCDFYIPSLNLYIEFQGTWTHGGKPYEGTKEDLEKVNIWKIKNTEFYESAINVWTVRDVKKRNWAKEHNLNWLEFFDLESFLEWYEKQ